MALKNKILAQRNRILRVGKKYGAISFRLFGSVAKGKARRGSDYDFLVELEPGRSLLDLGGLQVELENLLGRSVDVVTPKGLRKKLKSAVLKEALPL
ncbi:MAG: nucleotidyltransferase family protein [Verrucomicrobiota bacterium]